MQRQGDYATETIEGKALERRHDAVQPLDIQDQTGQIPLAQHGLQAPLLRTAEAQDPLYPA